LSFWYLRVIIASLTKPDHCSSVTIPNQSYPEVLSKDHSKYFEQLFLNQQLGTDKFKQIFVSVLHTMHNVHLLRCGSVGVAVIRVPPVVLFYITSFKDLQSYLMLTNRAFIKYRHGCGVHHLNMLSKTKHRNFYYHVTSFKKWSTVAMYLRYLSSRTKWALDSLLL